MSQEQQSPIHPVEQQDARSAPKRYRIDKKIKQAVDHIVYDGCTQRAAAQKVGLNENSVGRALRRENVQAYKKEQETLLAIEVNNLEGRAKTLAYITGLELLKNAKSESVKARMVELFTSDGKKGATNQVNVQINTGAKGYEFAPHGAQIVEIQNDAEDGASSANEGQAPEN